MRHIAERRQSACLALFLAILATVAPALAQPAAARFEVASVKPCQEGATPTPAPGRGGSADSRNVHFHLPCATAKDLILQAYYAFRDGRRHPPPFPPIEGGPSWIDSARYVIDAVADAAVPQATMNGPMLQALLEDRFQLKLRRETRESPAYALVAAKGGVKLKPYREGDCVDVGLVRPLTGPPPKPVPGERPVICGASSQRKSDSQQVVWDVRGVSLDYFCRVFLGIAFWDRPVVNRTGLDGLFNIHLEFTSDEATPGPPTPRQAATPETTALAPGPSLFSALQEQLGLKLEPTKAGREFLVIDSISRPSAN